jgi:hypothetical protein
VRSLLSLRYARRPSDPEETLVRPPPTNLRCGHTRSRPKGDSEGIAGLLYVHQDGETRQFDLKLSKGQVVLPVAPGTCQVDITLAGASDMRPGDFS